MADKSTSRDQPSDASAGGYTGHITTERAHPAREDSSSSVLPPPPAEDSPTQLKQQNAYLREEVKRLKESMSKLVSSAEMEEEYITNKVRRYAPMFAHFHTEVAIYCTIPWIGFLCTGS
eukprot:gb/GECG01006630.1/.p1 GENE.gb/GECG01006630.1/~~gb/GECG01006630.1/.p1  ORF type:complete len:119 (+),score=15.17 gb/GECG01006630.1/:1-357(+)